MGYEEIPGSRPVSIKDLWAGWFPLKTHGDIPGSMFERGPIGANDCSNVIYFDGALRKIFGYEKVTAAALNGGGSVNSLFYSQVLGDVFGNAGNKLYKGLDTATPTDITNALTISSTALIDWTEWQLSGTRYAIGTDGVNPVFKHDGTTSSVVANAPTADFVLVWQNALWAVTDEKVSFSNLGDIETWDADDNYIFDSSATGIGKLGQTFVFFAEDHIGIMSGDNNRLLTKVDRFIDGVGASGKQTIINGKLNNQDVLIFHANDGFYAFDGSQNIIKLSGPIDNKYQAEDSNDRWNATLFAKAWATYDYRYNWYVCGLADGADTSNQTLIHLDCGRLFTDEERGPAVPHWPMTDMQAVTSIEFSRNQSKLGDVLFGSSNGFVYQFNPGTYNRDGAVYSADYKSKIFDMVNSAIVGEFNVLSKAQGSNSFVTAYINTSLEEGDGLGAQANFMDSSDVLDTTFFIGASELSGRSFILRNIGTSNFGRYFQFKLENNLINQPMIIHSVDMILQQIGVETNVGN